MAITFTAQNFGPAHKEKGVLFGSDIFRNKRLIKTWPSCTGFKLGNRGKQGCIATYAVIRAPVMAVPEFSGKSLLSSFFSANLKLLFGQIFPPLAFCFCDFFGQVLFSPLDGLD
jgi:hypothetical protein